MNEGNYTVEASIVLPLLMFLIIGLLNITIYIFTFEQKNLMKLNDDICSYEKKDEQYSDGIYSLKKEIYKVEIEKTGANEIIE